MSTFARHDHADRLEEDDDVEEQRVVLDVVKIVLQFLNGVVERRTVVIADLRPPGHAGLDAVPYGVIRYLARELVDEVGALGPRPDEAHVADQDVDELRELVDAELPD